MSSISYVLGKSLYLNITNRCSNDCTFCIRRKADLFNKKHSLWLEKEPMLDDIIHEIPDPKKFKEIVFCGYGEPLMRFDIVTTTAKFIKQNGGIVRVVTNGQANLIHGRDITSELAGLTDSISISLNAQNAALYDSLCHSIYGESAYWGMIDFIKEAKKFIPKVTCTVLNMPNIINIEACRTIAKELDVEFRIRDYYEEEYPEHEKHLNK